MEYVRKHSIRFEKHSSREPLAKKLRITQEDIEKRKEEARTYQQIRAENAKYGCKCALEINDFPMDRLDEHYQGVEELLEDEEVKQSRREKETLFQVDLKSAEAQRILGTTYQNQSLTEVFSCAD